MRLAVIGAGRMGRAIVAGLLARNLINPAAITGVSKTQASKDSFLALDPSGVMQWTDSLPEASAQADVLLLAVKPIQMNEVLPLLRLRNTTTLIISIAAGIRLQRFEELLGSEQHIARAMPNTPVTLGCGVTAYCPNARCTPEDRDFIKQLFQSVGACYEVEENQLDAVTALSGSGPAFFYRIIQAFSQAAIQEGLSPEQALRMAAQTAEGSAKMILDYDLSPDDLIKQVVSKGGTTEAGLNVLDASALSNIVAATIHAAAERSRTLSKI